MAYKELIRLVKEVFIEAGTRKPCEGTIIRRPPSPWWDSNCKNIIQNKLNAYKRKTWNITKAFKNSKRIEDLNAKATENKLPQVIENFEKTISTENPLPCWGCSMGFSKTAKFLHPGRTIH
ncbi:uncharacterized protein LOC116852479 [Odontomachus brunneus]|uniref:uncharacterized protein LOC116852479 n=1 Tax=Odontomachus brunneus TaxID=486640 RepID=UPI0013F27166|nr:uncharacterized protein LOC116852479 [Odontomachus brunneus]